MTRSALRDFLMPWSGLAIGIVAAGVDHQFGAEGVFNSCGAISPVPILIVSLLAIAATVLGALLSVRILRDDAETQARKVIAAVSVGSAALFVFAMILPVIASLILPACFQ
jgi:hypothetical protein